jgi:hypothetical protein
LATAGDSIIFQRDNSLPAKHLMKLIEFLSASSSTAPFKEAVEHFINTGSSSERISFPPHAPSVKVARTLTKLLSEYPELEIDSVRVAGRSGCEYFRGDLMIRTTSEERKVQFDWDCKWKANQLGWVDYFGFADQTRAAREFDYECFRTWDEKPVEVTA